MRDRARRGMAAYMAILLLLLVAVSLVALSMSFGQDARRTTALGDEAQLRQLLTAGAAAAMNGQTSLTLPPDLEARQASVTIAISDTTARITAKLGKRQMSQSVRFERRDERLIPVEAALTE